MGDDISQWEPVRCVDHRLDFSRQPDVVVVEKCNPVSRRCCGTCVPSCGGSTGRVVSDEDHALRKMLGLDRRVGSVVDDNDLNRVPKLIERASDRSVQLFGPIVCGYDC
jgi:hypothetical protein